MKARGEQFAGKRMMGNDGTGADSAKKALAELDSRIDKLRAEIEPKPRRARPEYRAVSLAWRMILEMTVGVCIGGAIGYALDEVTGLRPLFLVIFGGFGFAAGIQTMMRSAREFDKVTARDD